MTPEEWKELSAALDQLLDLPEEEQAPFLQQLRADNPRLCQEVESLLRHRLPTQRLDAPPPECLEALGPAAGDAASPLLAPDPAASKLPEIAGYEVHGLLGRGGMGVVYKARQLALNRVVALKMLRPGTRADEEDLLRFRTEAEASAQLQHPNIVQIYEVGEKDGQPFIALEYVAGGSLDRFLAGKPQPPRLAAEVVETLARAMHHAHTRGILHRDLKPANILLSGEGGGTRSEMETLAAPAFPCSSFPAPKIADFGLAKRLLTDSGQTKTGAVLGTPSYMAPEQAAGKKGIGPTADVFALGAILYEMLTGRPPFRGDHMFETLRQVIHDDPVAPSRLAPGVPRNLETICLKCLEKDPARRYSSAAALTEDLRQHREGLRIQARRAGPWRRTVLRVRRRPMTAALVGLVLALAAGGAFWLWREAPRPHDAGANPAGEKEAGGKTPGTVALVKVDGSRRPDTTTDETRLKDDYTVATLGMKMKLIKAGKFLMGSSAGEEGRYDNEGPQHEVEITKAFYMGVYPVTKGQFAQFAQDDGYETDAEKDGKGGFGFNTTTPKWEQKAEYTWRNPGFTQGDDHPVVQVSWNDATAFCAWLNKKEGKTYELPTEAEWEYACRAGTKTRFWCGDTDASLKGNANIADASLKGIMGSAATKNWTFVPWDDGYAFTSPVEIFKANPWGLYDMGGNVWQWCADGYGPYQEGYFKDPKGKDSVNTRVLRGGSWDVAPRGCRSAHRNNNIPALRHDNNGFRVVLRLAGL